MANWESVEKFCLENFQVQSGAPGALLLHLKTGSRTQLVSLVHETLENGGESWVSISSPVGRLVDLQSMLQVLLKMAGNAVVGGLVSDGEFVSLKHSVPLVNLDLNELIRPLQLVAIGADLYEDLSTGRDEY